MIKDKVIVQHILDKYNVRQNPLTGIPIDSYLAETIDELMEYFEYVKIHTKDYLNGSIQKN